MAISKNGLNRRSSLRLSFSLDICLPSRFCHALHTVPVVDGVALDIAVGCGNDLISQRHFRGLGLLEGSSMCALGQEHEGGVHAHPRRCIHRFMHSYALVLETDNLFSRPGVGYGLGRYLTNRSMLQAARNEAKAKMILSIQKKYIS
jgi:hypothetical protein